MYKKSSGNAQFHARSRVLNSRDNSGGPDDAFKRENELEVKRLELVDAKKDAEVKIGKLSLQIKIAKDRHWRGQDQVDFIVYERMEQQRLNLLNTVRSIDKSLHNLKIEKRASMTTSEGRFAMQFFKVAKEMLAEPVYNRIRIAALHRCYPENPQTKEGDNK